MMEQCMPDYNDFYIRIAGLNIRMLCSYPYAQWLCADFTVEETDADVTVHVLSEEIEREQSNYAEGAFSNGYCEGICLYRAIAERLPEFDGFVFHGAAVNINGRGVIFAAPSGVGKSTHVSLLLENYPENVSIVNGDKPIIRKIDGVWTVCSGPWAGKEGWKEKADVPLSAIVLLERAENNFIREIAPEDNFDAIMRQVYLPLTPDGQILTYDLIDEMAQSIKFLRLGCNITKEAADASFGALTDI